MDSVSLEKIPWNLAEVCVIGEFSKFTGSNRSLHALYQTQVFPLYLPSILKKKEEVPQKEFKQQIMIILSLSR